MDPAFLAEPDPDLAGRCSGLTELRCRAHLPLTAAERLVRQLPHLQQVELHLAPEQGQSQAQRPLCCGSWRSLTLQSAIPFRMAQLAALLRHHGQLRRLEAPLRFSSAGRSCRHRYLPDLPLPPPPEEPEDLGSWDQTYPNLTSHTRQHQITAPIQPEVRPRRKERYRTLLPPSRCFIRG